MPNYQRLTTTQLTELTNGLHRMARNLWWTWNQEAQQVFHDLSPRGWRTLYHNPVAVLHEVSDYELRVRLQNPLFAEKVKKALYKFESYLNEENTWAAREMSHLNGSPVAYFCAEFGFHETLPIAAGGLGALAGDHAKSASDLGLPFYGISLFYREGYFQQSINQENWQTEFYSLLNPKNLPIEQVLDASGEPIVCSVEIGMSTVHFQVWQVKVGRIVVYLLDTNRPENEQHFKDLTLRVYGGDSTTRIMQEVLLGIGGVVLLRKLGINPGVFHMNEGHAAFLGFELIREKIAEGMSFEDAKEHVKQKCIFTTHTPVEAGHDRFSVDLMHYVLARHEHHLKIPFEKLIDLGRVHEGDKDEPFCMTVLALKCSRAANGVSELHGQVSREMWHKLYPDKNIPEVPIGHITNGIHLMGWMKGPLRNYWQHRMGDDWDANINEPDFWKQLEDPDFISDEEIWALRFELRREMIEFTRRRLLLQEHYVDQDHFIYFEKLLNVDALTIGFARRFATYKRAPLVFKQFEKIVDLVKDERRPVQFIFAGKAHPRDDDGKKFIQHIIHLSKYSELKDHLVFIENYDIHVCRQMVSGCDVWLNNPRRPLEASGTSGQKISSHGGLNLSILDGWWREAYDGENGFAVGPDSHPESVEEQDHVDSENLYSTLVDEVIPLFYQRDANGIPRAWIKKMRHAMATLVPQYNTWRMVKEYSEKYYKW